jgi:hypothetical protein
MGRLGENLPADDLLLQVLEGGGDERRLFQELLLGKRVAHRLGDLLDPFAPLLLGKNRVGCPQIVFRHLRDLSQVLLAEFLLLENQFRLALLPGHLLLDIEDGGKGVVREEDCVEDLLLGDLGSFPLHHQDRVPAAGNKDVEIASGQVGNPGIDDELAVDPADPDTREGAPEGDLGEGKGRGGPDHGEYRRVVHLVGRQNRGDHLDLVVKPFREEGADRPVDHPGGEDLELGQPPFPLEEASRDLPDGGRLFHIVDDKGKEVDSRAGGFGNASGNQNHGLSVPHHGRAARLPC